MFLKRRRGKIIEGFGKLAAALRKENSGRIEFIGGSQGGNHGFLEMALFGKLRGARLAIRDVRLNLLAFLVADFVAGVENQKRRNVLASRALFKNAHRKPPNSCRSLRVARKSEFLKRARLARTLRRFWFSTLAMKSATRNASRFRRTSRIAKRAPRNLPKRAISRKPWLPPCDPPMNSILPEFSFRSAAASLPKPSMIFPRLRFRNIGVPSAGCAAGWRYGPLGAAPCWSSSGWW